MQASPRKGTKLAVALVVIVALIAILSFTHFSKASLSSVIQDNLDGATEFKVTSIEEMYDGKEPTFTDTKQISEHQQQLLSEIKNTSMSFERNEMGMVIDEKLYSIDISSTDDESNMSITLDKNGRLHVNDTETTYKIGNDNLYRLCESLFS